MLIVGVVGFRVEVSILVFEKLTDDTRHTILEVLSAVVVRTHLPLITLIRQATQLTDEQLFEVGIRTWLSG